MFVTAEVTIPDMFEHSHCAIRNNRY